jgi:hypothetical protein
MPVSDLDRNPVWPRYCSLRRNTERVKTHGELKQEASQCLTRFATHIEASSEVHCKHSASILPTLSSSQVIIQFMSWHA